MDVLWTPPKAPPDPNIRTAYLSDVHAEDDSGKVLCQRFQLLAPIGFGATAAVYRALDLETKSDVAVKILYKNLRDDAEALRYFAQEGRLAARIIHPHLLRAHFFGQRRRAPFIVFELVPGASLTQIAALRPIPWRRLAVIVLQVLDALAKLHEEGVIHGDIQPENVIVQQTTLGHDFAKVIDLGFASARGCSRLTQAAEPPAEVHGTASFIAPERLAGLDPDGRADLYSVGALMYFLLTTRLVPDISNAPEQLGVPAPSIMAPGARIPHAIDVVVMRALSDVDDRYPTAAAMAEALAAALAQPEAQPAAAIDSEASLPVVIDIGVLPLASAPGASIAADVQVPAVVVPLASTPATSIAADMQTRPVEAPTSKDPQDTLSPELSTTALLGNCRASRPTRAARRQPVRRRRPGLRRARRLVARERCIRCGHIVAEQAMNSASPPEADSAMFRRPAPEPSGLNLLPAAPPTPEYKATTTPPKDQAKRRSDPRVAKVRSAIHRCKPLVPFSDRSVTVEADPGGKTRILFSGREAPGDFGRCVGEVAARTKIADGERLSFKL
jgi:serine/threonine protein kinase